MLSSTDELLREGNENRVIIISTVRSNKRFLPADRAKGQGLIGEPKRFNVAMTRAKELLIVVGNAQTLVVSFLSKKPEHSLTF